LTALPFKVLKGNAETFEIQCYRKSRKIPYSDHLTTDEVLRNVDQKELWMLLSSISNWSILLWSQFVRVWETCSVYPSEHCVWY